MRNERMKILEQSNISLSISQKKILNFVDGPSSKTNNYYDVYKISISNLSTIYIIYIQSKLLLEI